MRTEEEAEGLSAALSTLDFRPGKAYLKGSRIVVPVYGKSQVLMLMKLAKKKRWKN